MSTLYKVLGSVLMIALLLLAGCSDRVGPSWNFQDFSTVSGRVTDGQDQGIAGVDVLATDGVNLWSTVTDEDGDYSLVLPAGSRVLAFRKEGWVTGYLSASVGGLPVNGNITLAPLGNGLANPPVINLDTPDFDEEIGMVDISGQIANLDTNQAVLIVNGQATLFSTDGNGNFDIVAVLVPGVNNIFIWAVNGVGADLAGPLTYTFTPEENIYFRATLTWDGEGDLDLHTWDPNMAHSSYWNQMIPTGILDFDVIPGNGPENFSCTALAQGRFRIAVNAYSLWDGPRNATLRVAIFSGPNAGQVYSFGPYLLTVGNNESDYPVTGNTASWWRPCDVLVSGSTISVVAPDATPLPEDDGVGMSTRGPRK